MRAVIVGSAQHVYINVEQWEIERVVPIGGRETVCSIYMKRATPGPAALEGRFTRFPFTECNHMTEVHCNQYNNNIRAKFLLDNVMQVSLVFEP